MPGASVVLGLVLWTEFVGRASCVEIRSAPTILIATAGGGWTMDIVFVKFWARSDFFDGIIHPTSIIMKNKKWPTTFFQRLSIHLFLPRMASEVIFCEINVRCNNSYLRQGVGRSIPDISSMTTLKHSGIILNYYKAAKTLLGSVGHQRTAKSWTSARTRIVAAMVFILMNIDDGNNNDKVITLMMMIIIKVNDHNNHIV